MSTDKEKTETGGGDSPVLFGPSNDPRLSGRIDALTGDVLESAIARLGTFSDNVFGDDEDEDPFPEGIRSEASEEAEAAPQPVSDGHGDEGEDLDRILDKLSGESDQEVYPMAEEEDLTSSSDEVRSLQDIARMQEADMAAPTVQRSPIADVLAGSGAETETAADDDDYHDPGLPDSQTESARPSASDEDEYDPFADMDVFSEYDPEPSDVEIEDLPDEMADEMDDDFDPDFPDDDLYDPDETSEGEVDATAEQSDATYSLPEPSPYGDGDMMGSPYGYEDEPEEVQETPETDLDEADRDTEQDMLEDWPMPEEKVTENADDPVREPVETDWSAQTPDEEGGHAGSALDDLITGLETGPAQDPEIETPDEIASEAGRENEEKIPTFLRKGPDGLPISGVLAGTSRPDEVSQPEAEEVPEDETFESDDQPTDQEADAEEGSAPEPVKGSGRKRMLAGVAVLALLAAVGVGAYVMKPDLFGSPVVAEAPAPTPALAPLPDMSDPVVEEASVPPTSEPVFDVVELQPAASPDPEIVAGLDETTDTGVSPEVSDLLAELSREPVAPAPVGVSAEELEALVSRVEDVEQARSDAEARAAELTDELTSLTDQITGLLQRDSDQAERLERMERLIRGQSAILAQFGEMEESLEQTQVVLLDVSARIGAVEGQNPADRDAVNRALADVEDRIQALTANMSILARMSIEGVDALRAPNASSGTVGVQTAPAAQDASGGADPVFRSETGGFRISSDPAGRIPSDVEKDDFIEGYGYVLDVLPASDGQRLVIMENGSVLVPNGD